MHARASRNWAIATCTLLLSTLLLLRFLPAVAWPVVIAAIGAYLTDPIVVWMARHGLSRTAAAGLLIGLGGVIVGAVGWTVLPRLVNQAANLPAHTAAATDLLLARLAVLGNSAIPEDFEHLLKLARDHVPELFSKILPSAGGVVTTVVGGSLSVVSWVVGAFIVPVVGFYLLKDWPEVVSTTASLVPSKQRPVFKERMQEIDRVLNGFIRGQLTMAMVLSILYSAGMSLVGLKLGIVVGLVTGFGNLIPYVGTSCGVLVAVVSCLVDFGVDYHLALVLGMFGAIVIADSVFITPRIVGNRVGLSPAAVIVAVMTCGSLFGFGGVLLAVPATAILKVVIRVLTQLYRDSRMYREG